MAFAALTSIFTTGGLLSAPVTAIGIIPLLALGINFYRYQNVDPEARPIDAQRVNTENSTISTLKTESKTFSLFSFRYVFNTISLWLVRGQLVR